MLSCCPQHSLFFALPALTASRHIRRLPPASEAGWCQNNSIKKYQGIYELIKDCTSLSRIENGGKEHRVTTGAVTETQVHETPAQL